MARQSRSDAVLYIILLYVLYLLVEAGWFAINWIYKLHWGLLILLAGFICSFLFKASSKSLKWISPRLAALLPLVLKFSLGLSFLCSTLILNNIRNTPLKRYDERGNLIETYFLSKSRKTSGHNETFYANGRLKAKGEYFNGKKFGEWIYYDSNGKVTKYTEIKTIRVGGICNDGTTSSATGRGACSHHGGVREWIEKDVEVDH